MFKALHLAKMYNKYTENVNHRECKSIIHYLNYLNKLI